MDSGELVQSTWAALCGGDMAAVESALAPDAKWRAVQDGPWNCESRAAIIDVLGRQLKRVLAGRIEEIQPLGQRAIIGFRPAKEFLGAWPLDNGVRYVVLTFREGLVTEMKGCETRAAALAYAS